MKSNSCIKCERKHNDEWCVLQKCLPESPSLTTSAMRPHRPRHTGLFIRLAEQREHCVLHRARAGRRGHGQVKRSSWLVLMVTDCQARISRWPQLAFRQTSGVWSRASHTTSCRSPRLPTVVMRGYGAPGYSLCLQPKQLCF